MLTTESEAKEKWCPHIRGARIEAMDIIGPGHTGQFAIVGGCNIDRLGGTRVPASCRCIASACMQWRWFDAPTIPLRNGYCGIARHPVTD